MSAFVLTTRYLPQKSCLGKSSSLQSELHRSPLSLCRKMPRRGPRPASQEPSAGPEMSECTCKFSAATPSRLPASPRHTNQGHIPILAVLLGLNNCSRDPGSVWSGKGAKSWQSCHPWERQKLWIPAARQNLLGWGAFRNQVSLSRTSVS